MNKFDKLHNILHKGFSKYLSFMFGEEVNIVAKNCLIYKISIIIFIIFLFFAGVVTYSLEGRAWVVFYIFKKVRLLIYHNKVFSIVCLFSAFSLLYNEIYHHILNK